MRKILPFFIALLWSFFLHTEVKGQYYNQHPGFLKANGVWAFGTHAGLNFNNAPMGLWTAVSAEEGNASVADAVTGGLLFYSDGGKCWNRNHLVMPNGDNLQGNGSGMLSTTQGVCIVGLQSQRGRYYLFSLNGANSNVALGPSPPGTLFYSVVNMSLDGGLGDIVTGQKNIILDTALLSESMVAVPGNNCDAWLLVHTFLSPVFKAYHITNTGIDPTPVISTVGAQIQGVELSGPGGHIGAYMAGGMTISPDRQTLAICSFVPSCIIGAMDSVSGVLLCRFDVATGIVSDAVEVEEHLQTYSAAFSPDNNKLYLVNYDYINGDFNLQQYDVSVYNPVAIATSKVLVAPGLLAGDASQLKLYKDTLYLNLAVGLSTLGRIVQPNLSGTACGYQPASVPLLAGTTTGITMPAEVVTVQARDTLPFLALDTLVCTRAGEHFDGVPLTAAPGYGNYIWNDGLNVASRTITQPGQYWVLCLDYCHSRVDTYKVRQVDIAFSLGPDTLLCGQQRYELYIPLPGASFLWNDGSTGDRFTIQGETLAWVRVSRDGCVASDSIRVNVKDFGQDLGKDITLCKDAPVLFQLKANVPSGASCQWSTGAADSSLIVRDTGLYWVMVKDDNCSGSDTIRIGKELCTCFSYMASAFTPNGDGLNDVFVPVIEAGCPISSYMFSIYNRFGQRVFSSAAADKGWDGSYNGLPADAGTYMYELRFEGGSKKGNYYKKGDVTLIR